MPLQGLWNALIFLTTSRGVIKDVIRKKWGRWVFKPIKNNTEIVRRDSAPRVRVSEHTNSTDSASDVELRRLAR
jgi:hypothetical protein